MPTTQIGFQILNLNPKKYTLKKVIDYKVKKILKKYNFFQFVYFLMKNPNLKSIFVGQNREHSIIRKKLKLPIIGSFLGSLLVH